MSSIRSIKKDIDYLYHEVISDSYLTIYFHPEKKDEIVALMEEAVTSRNKFVSRASNPVEKNNPKLVKKHFAQLRRDLMENVDSLFAKISALCKK